MQLITVNEDQMINPDKIVSVETKTTRGKTILVVRAEGRDYSVDTPKEFLKELKNNGIVTSEQFNRV